MPYVNVKLATGKEKVSQEKKEMVIKGITQLLADILDKKPESTYVIIEEVDSFNWGVAGESIGKQNS